MARNRRSVEVVSTEEPTIPGIPPAETPPEAAEVSPPSPEEIAANEDAARLRAEEEAQAAAAEAERQRQETEAAATAIVAAEEEQARASLQARINACTETLKSYFVHVRRTSREDAVEWLGRMHGIDENIAGFAFDALVSGRAFGKETVERPKTITVQVDEYFLKSKSAAA